MWNGVGCHGLGAGMMMVIGFDSIHGTMRCCLIYQGTSVAPHACLGSKQRNLHRTQTTNVTVAL